MGSESFWVWMMWLHLSFVLVPALIYTAKLEWDDLNSSRRISKAPLTPAELSEHLPAA